MTNHVVVSVLDNGLWKELPRYESATASGLDVKTHLSRYSVEALREIPGDKFHVIEDADGIRILIEPHGRFLFPTGLKVAIPVGKELQVRPRSGLALKQGITVLNSPGTIDSDFRGEIGVILINTSDKDVVIKDGERIAQLVLAPVEHLRWDIVTELPDTDRGEGGFGSTNK